MNWLEFLAKLVDSAAWPAVAGAAIYVFRERLNEALQVATQQLQRVGQLKVSGVEVVMQAEKSLAEKEQEADSVQEQLAAATAPEERENLAAKLREALDEAARLRALVEKLSAGTERSEASPFAGMAVHSSLRKLALKMGFENIREPMRLKHYHRMKLEADEALMGMSVAEVLPLRSAGYVLQNGQLTTAGLQALVALAREEGASS
ncbi:hypothetical protein [Aquincola sp. J276]|uniref:hypothetical protein n=1 Tax=Aquincola sp. J276 TaxID=2898432 RepID=UPI0021511750|nr:hypothetical protein [Aquincola sp. J276]MCR5865224.1 hypothetical protein [Aquincola sp. J276]